MCNRNEIPQDDRGKKKATQRESSTFKTASTLLPIIVIIDFNNVMSPDLLSSFRLLCTLSVRSVDGSETLTHSTFGQTH